MSDRRSRLRGFDLGLMLALLGVSDHEERDIVIVEGALDSRLGLLKDDLVEALPAEELLIQAAPGLGHCLDGLMRMTLVPPEPRRMHARRRPMIPKQAPKTRPRRKPPITRRGR